MKIDFSDIFSMGKGALLIRWRDEDSLETLRQVHFFYHYLRLQSNNAILDLVPAYDSLCVFYRPEMKKSESMLEWIKAQAECCISHPYDPVMKSWEIPVRFAKESEDDMKTVLRVTGLSQREVIDAFCSTTFLVAFIGFLPGFPYLHGLPDKLIVPRKQIHDRKVAGGSVAIGGNQAGIYPCDSPGGWHVIGRTVFQLLQPGADSSCMLGPGDSVTFIQE